MAHKRMGVRCFLQDVNTGKFLFILRDDKPDIPWPNTWNSTGGKVEPGETTEQAAVRETYEEVGVTPTELEYLTTRDLPLKYRDGTVKETVTNDFYLAKADLSGELTLTEGRRFVIEKAEQIMKKDLHPVSKEVFKEFILKDKA